MRATSMKKTLLAAAALSLCATPLHAQFHRLEAAVPLKSEAPDWDYLSLDPVRNHLFIAALRDLHAADSAPRFSRS
jgi:hypothetical protein